MKSQLLAGNTSIAKKTATECLGYAMKILGPSFKGVGYEVLPTASKRHNFMITMRHVKDETLDIVFSFVVSDEEARGIIDKGFESKYPLPNFRIRNNDDD